jgi:hypothetical protein
MGVSGSGKSTVGALLAQRLHWEFTDADLFHPASNVDKMHKGIPLTNEDRWPWLRAIAAWIDKIRCAGGHGIVACSALPMPSARHENCACCTGAVIDTQYRVRNVGCPFISIGAAPLDPPNENLNAEFGGIA